MKEKKEKPRRDVCVHFLAKAICMACGVEIIDSRDGSSNWWMFCHDAEQLIVSLEKRGFTFNDAPTEIKS